uniref:PATROL1-like C-terminal domain-containing protein n=1 Tax=Toxoplasma gondii COUG TaxID=1074873 RepID=A0A2G8Y5Y9_TOXGO|nr:hypothetical protein TGCOUG_242780B [Toxoplasma gondii COUG]
MGQRMWGEDEDQKRQRREKHRHSAGFSGDFLEPPCPRGAPSDAGESSAYESAAPSDVESSTRRGRKSFFQVFDSSRGARAKGGAESDGERKEASRASERSSLPPPAPCQQVEGAARTKRGDCSRRRGRGLSLRLKAERETQAARIGPDLALLLQGVDEAERMQRRSCEALAEETRAGRGDTCDEKEEREGKQKRDEENKNRRPDCADGSARCGERSMGGTQSQGVLRWLVKLQNVDMFMRELQKLQAKLRAELERRARERNPKDVEIVEKLATLAGVSEASEEEVEREESEGGIARNQRRAFCQVEQDAQILDLEEMLNQRMQQLHDLLHNTALKVCETAAAYIVYYELQHDIFDRLYGEKEFSFYTLERIVAALPNTVERFFAAAPEGYQDEAAAAFTRCLTQAWCLLLTELGYSGHVFSESEVGTLEADLESLRHYMKDNEISPIFEIASASGEKVSLDMLEKVEDFLVMLARDGACLARVESEKEAERRRTSERDGAGARERSRSFFRGRSSSRRRGSMSPRAGSEEDGKRSRGVSPAFFSFATRAESGNRGFPGETESHAEPVFRAGGGRTSDEDGKDEKKKKGGMGSVGRWMKKNLMGTSAPAKSETDRSRDVSQARAPSDSGDEWNLR